MGDSVASVTLNPLGTFGVFVDERGGISGNSGHHITGVMWGGNQRIDQWIKWWVCFADAVGSNLEWAGNLLKNGGGLGVVMWYKGKRGVFFCRSCVNVVGWSLGGCYGWG